MSLPYNLNDKQSIIEYAKLLKGKTLREALRNEIPQDNYSGKGKYGQTLEKFYFKYEPNSESEPDFAIAGLELKSSPLKQLNNNDYRSKERLVLNIINYREVVNQDFETSSFWKKNANILLVFYLHQAGCDILDYLIKLVDEWSFPSTDLEIIRKDWELIKKKIADGKAHELSEGDTFYLGACTKGANADSTRKQPFSNIAVKIRAYSLKQGYVNHIIASIANESLGTYGKLIPSLELAKSHSIEEIINAKFTHLIGQTDSQLVEKFKLDGFKSNIKNFHSKITNAIFKVPKNKNIDNYIEEFDKAEIVVKTIRVNENNSIEQSISFPAFKFIEVYNESWISSNVKTLIDKKFLFIFFKKRGTEYYLEKVKFWNMPYSDRNEVRRVWLDTKKVICSGKIFKGSKTYRNGKTINFNNFPKMKDSWIFHVRPHGNNALETYPLPIQEFTTKQLSYTKQCFWIKNTYIRDEIFLK